MTDKLSEAVELLPCPFQHEVKRGMSVEFCEEFDCFRAFCCDCGACGPTADIADCGFSKRRAKAKAVAAWNTRSSLKGDEEMVERVKGALAAPGRYLDFTGNQRDWEARAAVAAISVIGE